MADELNKVSENIKYTQITREELMKKICHVNDKKMRNMYPKGYEKEFREKGRTIDVAIFSMQPGSYVNSLKK